MLLLLACASPDDTGSPAPFDPVADAVAAGPYAVGHVEQAVTYDDPEGNARTLRTAFWYPASEDTGPHATYLGGALESDVAREGAPAVEGAFPAVVYSHGHMAYPEVSSFLMEHLASHGFLVVAPEHTGNTTFDGSERDTAIYLQRPFDLAAALDALDAAMDWTGEAVAMGHSFGGYTVYVAGGATYDVDAIAASCADGSGGDVCSDWSDDWAARFAQGAADPRIVAALAMAPGDYDLLGADGAGALAVPGMLMTGEVDPEHDGDGVLYGAVHEARGEPWLDIAGAGHEAFTDLSGAMGEGTIDPQLGFDIVDAYALAFAAHATGDDRYDGLLDGSLTVDAAGALR